MSKLLALRQSDANKTNPIEVALSTFRSKINSNELRIASSAAESLYSPESFTANGLSEAQEAFEGLDRALKDIQGTVSEALEAHAIENNLSAFNEDDGRPRFRFTRSQLDAAAIGGVLAANPQAYFRVKPEDSLESQSSNPLNRFFADRVNPGKRMQEALESYDNKENANTQNFTIAYNLNAANQNEFGETFFQTVVMSPETAALRLEIPLIAVHDEIRHRLEQSYTEFKRRNLVDAEVDHKILKNDTLKCVPVFRTAKQDAFVPSSLVSTYNVDLEGQSIPTRPLAVDHRDSLLGLSQTDTLLESGILDSTAALDPSIVLEAVYIQLTRAASGGDPAVTEVLRIPTKAFATATATEALQGHTRLMQVNFIQPEVNIGPNTHLANGGTSTLLAPFQGSGGAQPTHEVFLRLSLRGDINLQDSNYELNPGPVRVSLLRTAGGAVLDIDDASNAALVDIFEGAKIIGFDLDARRVNSNLRERGQILDVFNYRHQYTVTLGSPICLPKPVAEGDATDAQDIAALVHTTRTRASNAAVTKIFEDIENLRQYKAGSAYIQEQPHVLGIASYLVKPLLLEEKIDILAKTQSVKQSEKRRDIKALLVDLLNNMAYRLWRDMNYQPASDMLDGGAQTRPTIIVGTDPVLFQYLVVDGDTRTLGPGFTYKIVQTVDSRMKGKIVLSFRHGGEAPGVPHPLSYGVMAYKSEIVAALPVTRNGAVSRELIVHPSFRHITMLPGLGLIEVENLDEALKEKLPFSTEEQ